MALEKAMRSPSSTGSTQLDEIVTMSNLANPDYQGWLTDELNGPKCWCVLADMLFCVFETEHSEQPLKVLLLPGMHVFKAMYQSAKQDSLTDQNREAFTSNKTVSGMHSHQFVLYDEVLDQKYVYGADSRSVIEGWITYLKAATNLDTDVFLDDTDVSSGSLSDRTFLSSPESVSSKQLNKSNDSDKRTRYTPPSRSAVPRQVTLSSTDNELSRNGSVASSDNNVTFSIGTGDLNGDVSSVTTTTSGDSNKSDPVVKRNKSKHSRTQSMDSEQMNVNNAKSPSSVRRQMPRLVRSNSASASYARSSIGAKIARTASNIRDKMFGAKAKDHYDATLGSLTSIKIAGYLHNKQLLKWIRLWCVISDGMIYGYRSEDPSAKPELALLLSECNLVTVETDKNKRMYIFKLCHLDAKNILLSAGNIYEFDRWFDIFKKEAVFKSAPSSAASTPRNDPNTSLQIDILGNIISKSTSPVVHKSLYIPDTSPSSQAQKNRNRFKLKLNRSMDSSVSISSQGSFTDHESDISDFHSSSINTSSQKQISPPPSHRHTSSPLNLDPSLSSFEANYLNSTKDQKKDTFWTEAYIKNYSVPQHHVTAELRRNHLAVDSESDVPESDDETYVSVSAAQFQKSRSSQNHSRTAPKFGGFPRHDENLKQVWKNDKNYQLHVLKTKVATLPNRPQIFNRHLPGPNNEGLLLVGDEYETKPNKVRGNLVKMTLSG